MCRVSTLYVFVVVFWSTVANAAPNSTVEDIHQELCTKAGIVSKEKLLVHLLRTHAGAMESLLLYPPKGRTESGLGLIRSLLSEPNACRKGRNSCGDKADGAMMQLRIGFNDFLDEGISNKTYSGLDPLTPASGYFKGSDEVSAISCTRAPDLVETPKKEKDESKLRIRGSADDLVYDRNTNKSDFKSASAAKISYTDDRSDKKTFTTKVNAVVGYAYNVTDTAIFSQQIIPYVAVNQKITNVVGQPTNLDDANSLAGGAVMNWQFTPNETLGHSLNARPQFLYNSKDRSEIASLRFTYQPWTYFKGVGGGFPLNINTTNVFEDPRSLVKLIFDIRSDNGYYTSKGNIANPMLHTSFARVGSQFGFSWNLVDYSLTLKATETLLYGYIGTVRKIDLFDTSVSYSLDPNNYFALSLEYQKGRDEDTTNSVQTWTVGLTAKY